MRLSPTEKEEVKALAKKASSIIKTFGWIQGSYHRDGQGYCLLGAINESSDVSGTSTHAWNLLVERIEDRIKGGNIIVWNDAKTRTRSQVLKVLRDSVPR